MREGLVVGIGAMLAVGAGRKWRRGRGRVLIARATQDADAEVRLEAATVLGPDGVAALHALVADPSVEDDLAARACAAALGLHADPQDEGLLLSLVIEGQDYALRVAAARALGHVGSAQAVPSLADRQLRQPRSSPRGT